MKTIIEKQQLDAARALYHLQNAQAEGCVLCCIKAMWESIGTITVRAAKAG